jgi:hypothetical protein
VENDKQESNNIYYFVTEVNSMKMGTLATESLMNIDMEALEFIARYPEYLETIRKVTKEEYYPALKRLEDIDPRDLVKPDTWFADENAAIGFVYRLFILEIRESSNMKKQ